MDLDRARAFVAQQHYAVLATTRKDGTPQLSPVLVAVDGDGNVVISTRRPTYKLRNIRRNPRVFLCVLSKGFFGQWIQLEGIAHVVELPDAMEPLVEYYRSISGEHPNWDEYRAAMQREQRVLLRIELTRAGPIHSP
jgi:PPOX class probable F420-dependent enzyme